MPSANEIIKNLENALLKLNQKYNLDISIMISPKPNSYDCFNKLININQNCPDYMYSFYHEYYHAIKDHENNSFQKQSSKTKENLIFIISVWVSFTFSVLFYPYSMLLTFIIALFILKAPIFFYDIIVFKTRQFKRHYIEHRADGFALKNMRRLPNSDWLKNEDESYTHPASISRINLLTRHYQRYIKD